MQKFIMLIDDSASLRQAVCSALTSVGYGVIEAADGKDALKKLDGRKVHLVICDVHMPVMDGITFVKEMKKLPHYRFVPIIMLTTEVHESYKEEGQIAGAKAWVMKPFRPEQVLHVVAKLILP